MSRLYFTVAVPRLIFFAALMPLMATRSRINYFRLEDVPESVYSHSTQVHFCGRLAKRTEGDPCFLGGVDTMADTSTNASQALSELNGAALEAKLRSLYARQRELREHLEATRTELNRINAEVLRTQDEYCTTPEREEEYWQ